MGCLTSSSWYTAQCSEFVTVAKEKNVTLPSTWTYSNYAGCDETWNSTAPFPLANDTLITFGLDSFSHAPATGTTTVTVPFSLAEVSTYFQNWKLQMYGLLSLAFIIIILAAVHWTIKTQNQAVMYADSQLRVLFGPGSGIFALIAFLWSIIVYWTIEWASHTMSTYSKQSQLYNTVRISLGY